MTLTSATPIAGRADDQPRHTVQVGEFTLTLRDVVRNDMAALLALHTVVFGPNVDARWHAWKYGEAPGQGQGQGVGAWHGSELVAFCGGLPRTVWRHNKSLAGLQIGDVMVHPSWRGIFTRRGPFFHVSQRFYDSRLGPAPGRPFQLGFGFPSERHLRLATMTGLLHDGGVIESLHWRTQRAAGLDLPWHWRWQRLDPLDKRFDAATNAAWKSMLANASDEGITIGQRDAAYLRWRYVDRPDAASPSMQWTSCYQFFELRRPWSRIPAGVAVLDLRSPSAHWLDWVGPIKLMPLALDACRLEAMRAGAIELTAWASAAVAQQLAQSGIERRAVCAGLGIPVASDMKPAEVPGLRYWLMGGDTDFL